MADTTTNENLKLAKSDLGENALKELHTEYNENLESIDGAITNLQNNLQELHIGSIEELNIGEKSGYIKYANEFLVCFGSEAKAYDAIDVGGIMDIDFSWPVRFIDPPFSLHSLALATINENSMKNYDTAQNQGNITTDGMTVTVSHNGTNNSRSSLFIYYLALGRWK